MSLFSLLDKMVDTAIELPCKAIEVAANTPEYICDKAENALEELEKTLGGDK